MTEKEIEQIKMVAKFMEINVCLFEWRGIKSIVRCDKSGDINLNDDLEFYSPNTSWKDLMAVVEKIIKMPGVKVTSHNLVITIEADISMVKSWQTTSMDYLKRDNATLIGAYHFVVIEFIKFYNQNKQS